MRRKPHALLALVLLLPASCSERDPCTCIYADAGSMPPAEAGVDAGQPDDAKDVEVADVSRDEVGALDGASDAPLEAAVADADVSPPYPRLLWVYHNDDRKGPIRSTLSLADSARRVFTGGFWGGGILFSTEGSNVPVWQYDHDGEVSVASALRGTDLYLAGASDTAFHVARFDASSSTPVWVYDAKAGGYSSKSLDGPGKFASSADGKVVALGTAHATEGTGVLLFESGTSTPTRLAVLASEPRQLALADTGATFTAHTTSKIVRYNLALAKIEAEYDVGSSTDCFAASRDQALAGQAWNTLKVVRWDGTKYALALSYKPPSGYSAGAMAIAADNDTVVTAWHSANYLEVLITRHSVAKGDVPIWTYTTPVGTGKWQDDPSSVRVSDDGRFVAIGTWGNEGASHGQFLVFDDQAPQAPYFEYKSSGSIMVVEVSPDGKYAFAGGKGTHASVSGNGGDVIAVQLKP